jgi:hypothetical protein
MERRLERTAAAAAKSADRLSKHGARVLSLRQLIKDAQADAAAHKKALSRYQRTPQQRRSFF